jgi:DNA-binding transcriptional regulator YiaG
MTLTAFVAQITAVLDENKKLRERVAELEAKPHDNKRKLSSREVNDIRAAHKGGMSQIDLANNYGVNPATISRTVRGFYH